MASTPRFGAALAACAALLLVLASAAGAGTEPRKKINPADQARARAINLKRSDLPGSGWSATKSDSDSSNPRCSYYNPDQSDLTETGDAESPSFTREDGTFVSSTVGIFQTAAQGRTAYRRVVQPQLPRCLAEVFRKGTGQAENVTVRSAGRLAFSRLAEKTDAYRVVAGFKTDSGSVTAYVDIVLFNRGRTDAGVIFVSIGRPFDAALERALAGKVAARMRG